ncbi:class I SAM-dependent methyltransferase [Stutzerimonas azotifigens]|uniref:Methyltransferase domain-containing protein n=1 Tax=Stutzerimonas azotifigens TaxID=291995 RepID=A0ABR5Z530_9GAMM|nr:class I SAM-dependent methyltransferase [Stutzerimonas azotifigens]MBA1275236.1 methyltransferase domain-containing protein [Stutzerimonas azotifigens]
MSAHFYRAFEDRYRGTRALIKERQQVYVPFIASFNHLYPDAPALDLGCGRGEWLEVLLENGFAAKGVDLDDGMLAACHALGLPAQEGDALAALQALPDGSQALVSGFHIAEHIPFEMLQKLVQEALRVLMPAGLLILETPNAENLVVGSNNFYLDPTHERPIPHLLLSFLTEHLGFARSKLLRLQEDPRLADSEDIRLMDVLSGPSPDYAIVAQKSAPDEVLVLFDPFFEREYGVALEHIAQRYDDNLRAEFGSLVERIDGASQRQALLDNELQAIHARTDELLHRANQAEAQFEYVRGEAQQATELSARTQAGLASLELRTTQMETTFAQQLSEQMANMGLHIQRMVADAEKTEFALRDATSRAVHAEAKIAATESLNESLQQQLQQSTSELLVLHKAQQRLEFQLEQTEARCADLERQLVGVEGRAKILEAEQGSAVADLIGMQSQIEYLETHPLHLSSRIEALAAQLLSVEGEKDILAAEVKSLRGQAQAQASALQQTEQQLNASLSNAHHWFLRANEYEAARDALLNSTSWKLTAPVRGVKTGLAGVVRSPWRMVGKAKSGAKAAVYPLLIRAMRKTLRSPGLKRRAAGFLRHYPGLYLRLVAIAQRANLTGAPVGQPTVVVPPPYNPNSFIQGTEPDISDLSLTAQAYYQTLKNAIQTQHKGPR